MESLVSNEGGAFDEDLDYFSDFLLSGMLDGANSVDGNTEHSVNNDKNYTNNSLDEEGKIIYSLFSKIKETGSFEAAPEDEKEIEQVEDKIDISNYLQTVLNCDNTENVDSLESSSDNKASVGSKTDNETKKRKLDKSFEDGDKESCESDQLYEDISKALGEIDYDIVDSDYYESYSKEENTSYNENVVNNDLISNDENDTGSTINPLKLRPIQDLLRADVNEPFAPRLKNKNTESKKNETFHDFLVRTNHRPMESAYLSQLEPGQIRTGPGAASLCQPSGKWQCWPSRLSQVPKNLEFLSQPTGLQSTSSQLQANPSMALQLQADQSMMPQLQANPSMALQLQADQSMMPQLQANPSMALQLQADQSMMPQLQANPSMALQLQADQSMMPQLQANQSMMPQLQANQTMVSPSSRNQMPRRQPTLHSFLSPSQGSQRVLLPQRNQSVIASSDSQKVLSTSQMLKMISVQRNQSLQSPSENNQFVQSPSQRIQSLQSTLQKNQLMQSPSHRNQFMQSPLQRNPIQSPPQSNQFMQSPLQRNPMQSPSQRNQFMQSPLQRNPIQSPPQRSLSQRTQLLQSSSPRLQSQPIHQYPSPRLQSQPILQSPSPRLQSQSILQSSSPRLQSQAILNVHSPAAASLWSLRGLGPNTIHHRPQLESSNTVHYRPSVPSTKSPRVEFQNVFSENLHNYSKNPVKPKNLASQGGDSVAQNASATPAPSMQTYNDSRLPPGWHLTGVIRKSGVSKGKFDFYIHGMGKRFRSMPEIVRFYDLKRQTEEIEYIDYKGIEESIKAFRKQLMENPEPKTEEQD